MSVPSAPGQAARKKRSLALVLLPVLALGAAAVWFLHSDAGTNGATSASSVHFVLHLDTFVLNLSGGDERAYLRAGVDLGLRDDPQHKGGPAVPVALIRDTILGVLATAHSEEILTSPGKQALKGQLLRALRERVPWLGVEEVYFTEFLIQR